MEIILELLVAVILGALGVATPLNTKLKAIVGVGLIDLIKPNFELPKPEPVKTPTFDDFMSNLGEYTLVEEDVYKEAIRNYPPKVPKLELVQGKGKAAMVIINKLSNDTLAIGVRWPSGWYYYMDKNAE